MENAFEKLVRELDDTALTGLSQAVAKESGQRRQDASIRLEEIHPHMPEADKARAPARRRQRDAHRPIPQEARLVNEPSQTRSGEDGTKAVLGPRDRHPPSSEPPCARTGH